MYGNPEQSMIKMVGCWWGSVVFGQLGVTRTASFYRFWPDSPSTAGVVLFNCIDFSSFPTFHCFSNSLQLIEHVYWKWITFVNFWTLMKISGLSNRNTHAWLSTSFNCCLSTSRKSLISTSWARMCHEELKFTSVCSIVNVMLPLIPDDCCQYSKRNWSN